MRKRILIIFVLALAGYAEQHVPDNLLDLGGTTSSSVYPGLDDVKKARFPQQIWKENYCINAEASLKQILEGLSTEIKIPAKAFKQMLDSGKFPKEANEQYQKLGFPPSPPERSAKMNALLQMGPKEMDFPLNLTVVDESPKGVKKNSNLDNKYVVLNCLTCHSGLRANQVIVGAANHHLNPVGFSNFFKDARDLTEPIVKEETKRRKTDGKLWSDLSGNFIQGGLSGMMGEAVQTPYGAGGYTPFELSETERQVMFLNKFLIPAIDSNKAPSLGRGNNYAPFWDGLMLTLRNKQDPQVPFQVDYSGYQFYYNTAVKEKPRPVQSHAWFAPGFGKLYRYVENTKSPHYTNFQVPDVNYGRDPIQIAAANQRVKALIESTNVIMKLMKCLDGPPYPAKINYAVADKGCKLYMAKGCNSCHGNIEKSDSGQWALKSYFPKVEDVGTDPEYRTASIRMTNVEKWERSRSYDDINRKLLRDLNIKDHEEPTIQSVGKVEGPPTGYQPRPLVNLWARAPYGHNGVFPDVETLMTPEENRPKYYQIGNPTAYDFSRMGIPWTPLTKNEFEALKQKGGDPTRLVDTTELGRQNIGHSTVRQIVSDEKERGEIIECLKTLVMPKDL